jgi:hypothetical protein
MRQVMVETSSSSSSSSISSKSKKLTERVRAKSPKNSKLSTKSIENHQIIYADQTCNKYKVVQI